MPSRVRVVLTMQDGTTRAGPDARRRLSQLGTYRGAKSDWDLVYRDGLRAKLFSGLTIFRERRGISNHASQYFQQARRKHTASPRVARLQSDRDMLRAIRPQRRNLRGAIASQAVEARPLGRPAIGIFA